jgi:FKBP-type peptidyl-prolyl cis-trans isomerase
VFVHWAGRTIGYQGKRIENTSARDEPFQFVLGSGQAIPAFEEAVAGMRAGGVRRLELAGERPELGWDRDRSSRYLKGPKPKDFDGQRALDFVLDNPTLQPFNRTLLLDVKLLSVRQQ